MEGMVVYSHRKVSQMRSPLGYRIRHDRIINSETSGEIVMIYEGINRECEFFVPYSDVNECLKPNIVGPELICGNAFSRS
jgi:hypothetical protein